MKGTAAVFEIPWGLMDNSEARRLADEVLTSLRCEPYHRLVERYLGKPENRVVIGASGRTYQVEVLAFWDGKKDSDLRVTVSIDDGGWRAFVPLTTDFIINAGGSFIDE